MKAWHSFLLLCTALLLTELAAFAAVPPIISYQGKLASANGNPVVDGTYTVHFAIYDVPTGGAALWSETNQSVQAKRGLFSVLLGSVVNLPANIFDNSSRFFGVQVGADPEMTPRQQIASVPFAVRAGSADTVPDGAISANKLAVGASTPPGTVAMFAGSVAPIGYLLCDGRAVARADYAALFATIGTTYGAGDGTSTFNLPDFRQRFPLGKTDSGTGSVLGGTGGSIDHKHKGFGTEGGDLRAMIGSGNGDAHNLGFLAAPAVDPDTGETAVPTYVVGGWSYSTGGYFNHYTPVLGHTGTANPPFLAVNYIVKY